MALRPSFPVDHSWLSTSFTIIFVLLFFTKYRTWLCVNLLIFISETTLQNSSYIYCSRGLLKVFCLVLFPSLSCYESFVQIREGADKPLAQLTSRCRRTESVVSLERGDCLCAELQVFSCYRGWKEACQETCTILTTWRRELPSSPPPPQGKASKEIHTILVETLGEHASSYAIVKNWVAQFKRGDFSTCVAPRPGRTKTVTTPEIIDQIHELILKDRRISTKSIAEQLGISREQVGSVIHEDLDMRKLSANWVPKCLNTDQKRQRCQSSEQLLEFFRRDPNISCCDWWSWTKPGYFITTRRQSNNQWSGVITAHLAHPKKFRVQKSAGKVLASIF